MNTAFDRSGRSAFGRIEQSEDIIGRSYLLRYPVIMNGSCAFCGKTGALRESHILPAFVYRWLRDRSGTGHIRNSENPNLRVQDGLKLHWLCDECEQRFNQYETAFASKVFHPWHAGVQRVLYEEWLLKFCVSISWRVLSYTFGKNPNRIYTEEQTALAARAEKCWKAFLNNEVPNPGVFEQHLVIFDVMESTTVQDLPNNFNRFMTGAITLDIIGSAKVLMTFAKLGRFMIFGLIQEGLDKWKGTKVHVKQEVLEPGELTIPYGIITYLKDRSITTAAMIEAMSPTQHAKVQAEILKNPERFVQSDQFSAIRADIRMFGPGSFVRKS